MKQWIVRLTYGLVFAWNILCAVQFIIAPDQSVAAYELSGRGATAAVQGMGVAFLMWNVTYPLVIISPAKHRTLAVIVLIQQLVGIVGEMLILASIGYFDSFAAAGFLAGPAGALEGAILRFLAFDVLGFVLMIVALVCSQVVNRNS